MAEMYDINIIQEMELVRAIYRWWADRRENLLNTISFNAKKEGRTRKKKKTTIEKLWFYCDEKKKKI